MSFRATATLATVALLVLGLGAASGRAGGATAIANCGQTVTTNAVVIQDLTCSGPGIVVGASGITIDLKGFTLLGDRDPTDYGIDDSSGYDQVTVKNGTVRNFGVGVIGLNGSGGLKVTGVVAAGNSIGGIAALGDSASIASSTVAGNASYGVDIFGDGASVASTTSVGNTADGIIVAGDGTSIKSSTVAGNGDRGIVVAGDAATIKSTRASGNGGVGIVLNGNGPSISGNTTDGNGFAGGVANSIGLGVNITGFTTAPKGKNVARGNDDPAECNPSSLC